MSGSEPAQAYHHYLGPAMFVPVARLTLTAANLQPGEHVLDVACGTGIVTAQLPGLVGATGRVVGLDISPAMLAVAAAGGGAVEWKEGDATALDLPVAAFDVVLCQQGLQFFPDRAAGVREMRRVLRPGGRAIVACWQGLERQSLMASLVRAQARHLGLTEAQAATPFSLGDAGALRALFVDAGFSRVDIATHAIEATFPQPELFLRMTASAAIAVMPASFARTELEPLIAAVTADCAADLARYRDGDRLRFPMPTHLAIAIV